MAASWGALLVGQLQFYWQVHLHPRLIGLTDDEYFWEPVPGCWSIRRGQDGRYVLEGQRPEPNPPPVTTIAWRLNHLAATCFANRTAAFFGGPEVPPDATMADPRLVPVDLPGSAAAGISFLERTYRQWLEGISGLDDDALQQPLGFRGGHYADDSMAALIVHINREAMHHGGELCLLRDLYRASGVLNRESLLR